jgi:transposase
VRKVGEKCVTDVINDVGLTTDRVDFGCPTKKARDDEAEMKIVVAIYRQSNKRLPCWTATQLSSSRKGWSTRGDAVREFYAALEGPVIVGIEASGAMPWFLELLDELGMECRVGHPAKIRAVETRKQKHASHRAQSRLATRARTLDAVSAEGGRSALRKMFNMNTPLVWMAGTFIHAQYMRST